MYHRKTWFVSVVAILLLLAGSCTPQDDLPPQAALEARRRFAEVKDVPTANVAIVDYEHVDWPDDCLGLEPRLEPCTEETTGPGPRSTETPGNRWKAHRAATPPASADSVPNL